MNSQIKNSFLKLQSYLEKLPIDERFKGVDPFDGLNSPIIKNTFLGKSRIVRLAWVQFFKRNPFNFRKLVGIKKEENPQALAVFLSSYCKLYETQKSENQLEIINYLANRIIDLRLIKWSGACWSYPFAWQARAFYQPASTPLIIPTAYCVNALLDAFDVTQNEEYKNIALSSADFVLNDLNRSEENNLFAFSYSPLDNSVVYNASLMASQVLARCYSYTKNLVYKETAHLSVKYCVNQQKENGSWTYGKKPFHQWIDNFHSGYNLTCLADYIKYCDDHRYDKHIELGLDYYLNQFFDKEGFSHYFTHNKYPLDLNNPAQLIITLLKMDRLQNNHTLVDNVMNYTIENMQSKKGWFYYQKNKWFTNRIVYLRWSNAWMFYAFSLLSSNENT